MPTCPNCAKYFEKLDDLKDHVHGVHKRRLTPIGIKHSEDALSALDSLATKRRKMLSK